VCLPVIFNIESYSRSSLYHCTHVHFIMFKLPVLSNAVRMALLGILSSR
jgi:hypothetical protein